MAAPQEPRPRAISAQDGRALAVISGGLALVAMIAALRTTFQSPDRMPLIASLYAAALAAAVVGARLGRSSGIRSNGLKMLSLLVVLACLTTVVVWTALGTWSTIGKCERHEESVLLTDTRRVWYEGTACTQEDRESRYYDAR